MEKSLIRVKTLFEHALLEKKWDNIRRKINKKPKIKYEM
jgi:hypothetical protein